MPTPTEINATFLAADRPVVDELTAAGHARATSCARCGGVGAIFVSGAPELGIQNVFRSCPEAGCRAGAQCRAGKEALRQDGIARCVASYGSNREAGERAAAHYYPPIVEPEAPAWSPVEVAA